MRAQRFVLLVAALVIVSACSNSDNSVRFDEIENGPAQSTASTPAPAPTTTVSEVAPTSSVLTQPAAEALAPSDELADLDGLIASAGGGGITLLTPGGKVLAQFPVGLATQPTRSRDGSKLVANLYDRLSGQTRIGIVDVATLELAVVPTNREYFFFTWSHDGSMIVALGPGSTTEDLSQNAALDILDSDGALVADTAFEGLSIYPSWESGGDDITLHVGGDVLLVEDLTSFDNAKVFEGVGEDFQTASWIPGTRDIIYVDSSDDADHRLIRMNVDSEQTSDLGPVRGYAFITIHPDGDLVALSHSRTSEETDSTDGAYVEIVNLSTGARTDVLNDLTQWMEWSPDGTQLAIVATPGDGGLDWHVWDGTTSTALGRYSPTGDYIRQYLYFADAYVETPCLWSPDSLAVTFTEIVDGQVAVTALRISDGTRVRLGVDDVAFWSQG